MLVFDCTSVNANAYLPAYYLVCTYCLCVRDNHSYYMQYVCVLKCSLSEDQVSKRAREDVQTKVPKETKMVRILPRSMLVYIWSCV